GRIEADPADVVDVNFGASAAPILAACTGLSGLESRQPKSPSVEGKRAGASGPDPQPSNEGVCERAVTVLKSDHGGKHLLLVLDDENVSLQEPLDGRRDVLIGNSIGALEGPDGLRHRNDADETWIFGSQLFFNPRGRRRGLNRIVLRDVADQD